MFSSVGSIRLRPERVSAVHDERLAADHRRIPRAEERDDRGHVLRLDEPPRRRPLHRGEHLFLVREPVERLGVDDSGRDAVDTDPPRSEVERWLASNLAYEAK